MKPRAFVFYDDATMRFLLEMTLEDRGYEVNTFTGPGVCPSHASPACECPADRTCADVCISGVLKPVDKGLDYVERQLNKGCRIKEKALVFGDWTDEDVTRAEELGCRVFQRPLDLAQIHRWLDEVGETIDPERRLLEKYGEQET